MSPKITLMSDSEVPMVFLGIVSTKVSTENVPIRISNSLITSFTLGYAMK